MRYFDKHRNVANFLFNPRRGRREGNLIWNRINGNEFKIHSPLTMYLKAQRGDAISDLNWSHRKSGIVAKDFAVLARFSCDSNDAPVRDGKLKDYFIAGVRGLGTWGAARYIDRNYREFRDIDPHEDFQRLLEVTYVDGNIQEVKDVSGETEAYFNKQRSKRYVANIIEQLRQ